MLEELVLAALVFLLGSNIWTLRELDHLRRRVDLCSREVTELDRKLTATLSERGPGASDASRFSP